MEQLVLRDIPTADTEEAGFKSLRLPPDTDPEDLADARAPCSRRGGGRQAEGRPGLSQITERGDGFVSVDGVRFDCALMAENFRALHRVFPYVCTCGCELEAWSQTLADPPMRTGPTASSFLRRCGANVSIQHRARTLSADRSSRT